MQFSRISLRSSGTGRFAPPGLQWLVGQGAEKIDGADQHVGTRRHAAEPPSEDIKNVAAAENPRGVISRLHHVHLRVARSDHIPTS
jgi:hypothetical protein